MFVSHSPPPPINCYNNTSNTTYQCIYSRNINTSDSSLIVILVICFFGLVGLISIYFLVKRCKFLT